MTITTLVLGDRYEIQQKLRHREMQQTFLVRDLDTSTLAIAKVLLCDDADCHDLRLFEQEANFLKTLAHPAIPGCLDYFPTNWSDGSARLVLIQPYLPGKSLMQWLRDKRTFSEVEVQAIGQALLEILVYLHGLQPPLVHRDIKPSNILMAPTPTEPVGQIYLVDFGAAATVTGQLESDDPTSTVVGGTYGFMSPEQLNGELSPASDLFSVGMTLVYLATGKHPSHLPYKNLRVDFKQFTHLSPIFVRWLQAMTEPVLFQRFTTAQAALTALKTVQTATATFVQPPTVADAGNALLRERQPPPGRVRIHRLSSTLEIVIHPAGIRQAASYLGWLAIVWTGPLPLWTLLLFQTLWTVNPWLAGGLILCTWSVGLGLGALLILLCYVRVRLQLNQQRLSLTYELLGRKFTYPQPTPIQQVQRIQYIGQPNLAQPSQRRVQPQLVVWAGPQKYELGKSLCSLQGCTSLTLAELDWIAEEISSWLKLPIESV